MSQGSQLRRRKSPPNSILDVYNLTLAAFCFASPWLFAYAGRIARIDLWVSGGLIAIASVGAILAFAEWKEWLNLLLGPWLVAAPWIFGFAHTRATHTCVATGAFVEAYALHRGSITQTQLPKLAKSGHFERCSDVPEGDIASFASVAARFRISRVRKRAFCSRDRIDPRLSKLAGALAQ